MKRVRSHKELPESALKYILEAFIPYTDANIKLAFKPAWFFRDLERIDRNRRYKKETLKKAYYKAVKANLIELDDKGVPRLTTKGQVYLKPFRPKRLKGSKLMVIFDIPEVQRSKRNHLRLLLVELKFKQVQKSVWVSDYDSREYLQEEIRVYKLAQYVEIYEAKKLNT